jgi:hypothetical protein
MNVKIDVGAPVEVPGEDSSKRSRGRPANVGHFHGYVGPEQFLRIIFERMMGILPILSKFVESFGPIPGKITVLTNTVCSWRMTTKFEGKKPSSIRGGKPLPLLITRGLATSPTSRRKPRDSSKWSS